MVCAWRQCGWWVVCRRPGRRRREIARLGGKSPSPRLAIVGIATPVSARLAPLMTRGCSGGLIMLASAWKREGSPVARVRSCGQIAGRLRADCGQIAGGCGETVRGDWSGRLCGEIAAEIAGESEGCWSGWGWCG